MSWAVLALVPRRLRWAEVLGRRSLAVYALHVPVVFVAQVAFERAGLDVLPATAAALAVTLVTLAVLARPVFDRAVRSTATTMADVVVPVPLRRDPAAPEGAAPRRQGADVRG